MNIIRTPFTHLSALGKINGDIHHANGALKRKGRIVFAHGYKGFKDWGAWELMGDVMALEGWDFVRFNFSHNGHVEPDMLDCTDEKAWSENTYSIEKLDLESILEFTRDGMSLESEKLIVIGHSRGGGIASLAASSVKVDGLVLLASVCDFESRFPNGDSLEQWRSTGKWEILNGRTKQILHHSFKFYEDFMENRESLNIEKAVRSLTSPVLVIHGDSDPAVNISEGRKLLDWANDGELFVIQGAAHTFGAKHPWEPKELPSHTLEVVNAIKKFISKVHIEK